MPQHDYTNSTNKHSPKSRACSSFNCQSYRARQEHSPRVTMRQSVQAPFGFVRLDWAAELEKRCYRSRIIDVLTARAAARKPISDILDG